MDNLFDKNINSNNELYLAIRDNDLYSDIKEYCMDLWENFTPYADPLFVQEFAIQPHQRFWEMYLGASLLNQGYHLKKRLSDEGPDIHLIEDDIIIWIEATVAGEGKGVDSVPTLKEYTSFVPIPEENIILRYANAISEKFKKLKGYLRKGIVKPSDGYVIGINGGEIGLELFNAAPILVAA